MMTTVAMGDTSLLDTADAMSDVDRAGGVVGRASRPVRRAAARAGLSDVDVLLGEGWAERAAAQLRASGGRLTGPDGFLSEMVKRVLEAGLAVELTEHLGYDRHDPGWAQQRQLARKSGCPRAGPDRHCHR